MATMMRWAVLASILLWMGLASAQDWPTLRRTNYIAILGSQGKEMKISLRSQRHPRRYGDELAFTLVGPDSNEITSDTIPLDTSKIVSVTPKTDGLCVLELDAGWNICFVDAGETPWALVASETLPLHTIHAIERLYFYVPAKCKRFSLFALADVRGEAALIKVFGPQGQTIKEEEGEFDKLTRIQVDVPPGADGKVWSLSVLPPRIPNTVLDDVAISLDPSISPYFSKKEEWALMFGRRKHE